MALLTILFCLSERHAEIILNCPYKGKDYIFFWIHPSFCQITTADGTLLLTQENILTVKDDETTQRLKNDEYSPLPKGL